MKNRRWLWIGLAATAVVVVIVVGALITRARGSATADLQTTEAVMGSLTAQVGATGTVHANQAATLTFQTTGTVDKVEVAAGDSLAKGDVLATLERTSLGANVILAQADLVAAERALEELRTSATAKAQAELAMANAEKALKDEEYRWRVQQQGTRASPETVRDAKAKLVLAEYDVDRHMEIIYASYDGRVHAFWLDKTEHSNWPYSVYQPSQGYDRLASEPVIADLDGNGFAEVIFSSWIQKGYHQTGKLHVLDYLGNPIYEVSLPDAYGSGDWNGALPPPHWRISTTISI